MTPWSKHELWELAFKVLVGDLAKRLLGVGVITKSPPQNFKGHFPKIKKNTKESFVQTTAEFHFRSKRNNQRSEVLSTPGFVLAICAKPRMALAT